MNYETCYVTSTFFKKTLQYALLIRHNVDALTAKGILELRDRFQVKDPVLDVSINIATWNIRAFGRGRRKASIEYIAEIISNFDLIAITELRQSTNDLKRVMKILGPYWKVMYSDTVMDRGGNSERIAYLYDERVIVFTGLVAEADPLRIKNKKTGEYESKLSWWRSPYIASFRAGKFDFVVITAHIRWGNNDKSRIHALERLAQWVDKRIQMKDVEDKDVFVMGDFNIPKIGDSFYKAITSKGLKVPDQLLKIKGTNLEQSGNYDQILYYPRKSIQINDGGVVDFYHGDFSKLYPKNKDMTYKQFTFQLSDHLPLWIQLDVWFDDVELKKIADGKL